MRVVERKILSAPMIGLWLLTGDLLAVTLPSRLPNMSKVTESIDPGLNQWIETYANQIPVQEMTAEQVLISVANKDPIMKALIILEQKSAKIKGLPAEPSQQDKAIKQKAEEDLKQLRSKTLADIPLIIAEELKKDPSKRHFALGDLYHSWAVAAPQAAEKSGYQKQVFDSLDPSSCSVKANAISEITRESLSRLDRTGLIEKIKLVNLYRSQTHKRKYLESLMGDMTEAKRKDLTEELREVGKHLPLLVRRYPWLLDEEEISPNQLFTDVYRPLRKQKCSDAEVFFKRHLDRKLSQESVESVVDVGSEIERCFRSERRSAAIEFWHRMDEKMKGRFGNEGALWVKVRIGYLKWVANDFDAAQKIYEEVLANSTAGSGYKAILAKTNYILGKIAEDKGDIDLSSKYYMTYLDKYVDQEDFEFALNSLIVNYASKQEWDKTIQPLEHFLDQQSLLHIDKRPIGAMAFSLFWLGRAHLHLGHRDLAIEYWRRLAAEYYSTFYGAMGHYLLEQSSGRNYAIEPSRVTGFDLNKLANRLPESSKRAVRRSLEFLKNGFQDKGRCEAEEIVPEGTSDYDGLLARALILHASGAWLEAIKIFDATPRSVRNGLPVGFERVLFPRKYADIVKEKSTKLDLDPDFVFALMRQESVFSKDAMSPVGAMGLMQLMPATAKLELDKLSQGYVDSEVRHELRSILSSKDALRDPKINVTLGVHHLWRLMKMYKSPVFALTAYNASPAATQKWQRTIASDDWLTFIERIPYKETRAYVKLILRNYFYYKRWYNSPDGKNQIHIDSVISDLAKLAKKPSTNQER